MQIIKSYPGGLGNPPDTWQVAVYNPTPDGRNFIVWAVCQHPVTVAGIGVPEFGSLYIAIALGAVAYFMLSRRFARQSPISAQV